MPKAVWNQSASEVAGGGAIPCRPETSLQNTPGVPADGIAMYPISRSPTRLPVSSGGRHDDGGPRLRPAFHWTACASHVSAPRSLQAHRRASMFSVSGRIHAAVALSLMRAPSGGLTVSFSFRPSSFRACSQVEQTLTLTASSSGDGGNLNLTIIGHHGTKTAEASH